MLRQRLLPHVSGSLGLGSGVPGEEEEWGVRLVLALKCKDVSQCGRVGLMWCGCGGV